MYSTGYRTLPKVIPVASSQRGNTRQKITIEQSSRPGSGVIHTQLETGSGP